MIMIGKIMILLMILKIFLALAWNDNCYTVGAIHTINDECRCQNRRISGRGSRTMRLRRMVIGGGGHDVYPGSGPLDGGNTLLPA